MELLLLFTGTAGRARLEQTRSFTCVQAEGSEATWPLAAHLRGSRSKKILQVQLPRGEGVPQVDESYGKHADAPGTAPLMSTRTHKGSQGSRNLLDKLKCWAG